MSLAPRLDLRQSQSLVMTPQLQQAIKLLALSNLEIETFIAEELDKNPLLEAQAGDDGEAREPEVAAEYEEREGPADAAELLNSGGDANGEAALDVDFSAETFHHDSASDSIGGLDGGLGMTGGSGGGGMSEDGPDFDNMASGALSLADHLMTQAGASIAGADLFIAAHLIDQIDEAGYLTVPLLDIANRLNVALTRVEDVLGVIQTFDP
ncbi:MAG: RNA polymerase sigma-54 factor, partial [Sphingomonadales bacterium]